MVGKKDTVFVEIIYNYEFIFLVNFDFVPKRIIHKK
jgi:hypothetical protein